jgi:hypothetical protein
MVQNKILRFFTPKSGSEQNSVGFSLLINSYLRNSEGFSLLRNGSEQYSEVFLFPQNRHSNGTGICSALFCILWNNFLLENGNPNTWGVLTPSGQYTGESWPTVVDFSVYFEQASEQAFKKVLMTKDQGVKTPQCIDYRGVLTTCQQVLL